MLGGVHLSERRCDVDRSNRLAASNRAVALRLVRVNGTISRVELAQRLGVTVAAMTNIVRSLIMDGLVDEAGSSASTGGKPRTLLRINGEAAYAVGVSVDINSTWFVLLDLAGKVIHALPPIASAQSVAALADDIDDGVRKLLADAAIPLDRVVGIGIAGQGPDDRSVPEAAVAGPYADQWLDVEVGDRVSQLIGMPVVMQNDANAVAAGEFGLSLDARSSGNFACVYLGESGLGSGIFVDKQLVLGSNSYAGAIAHLAIDVDGPECFCGSRGCLELYAAPRSMIEAVRAHDRAAPGSAVGVGAIGPITTADVSRVYAAARAGNAYATELVSNIARYLASASATMSTILDLDMIIFAGAGFLGAEDAFLSAAQDISDRLAAVGARRGFTVRMSRLGRGNDAAAVGAAVGVLESLPGTSGSGQHDSKRLEMPSAG